MTSHVITQSLRTAADFQAAAKEREREREERIIQKHLFGVPPPDDKKLFDDPAACFEYVMPCYFMSMR